MRARAVGEAACTAILVGGHESDHGRQLPDLPAHEGLTGAHSRVVAPGRPLERALRSARSPVVVLPMTLGRDPRLISDTARTVRWASARQERRIAVAEPFGTADHLVGWLRAACLERSPDAAVLITARAANPFDDAELHRVAALVRVNGGDRLVEVCVRTPSHGLSEGFERCRRLGASRVAVIPAEFGGRWGPVEPLLSPAVVASVVAARVSVALHRLVEHGDDHLGPALMADHSHGFAHSHNGDHSHSHAHTHDHTQPGARLSVG